MNFWTRLRGQGAQPDATPAPPYRAPLFLLRPPADSAVPFQVTAPTLTLPVSQLCTSDQFDEPVYRAWCAELGIAPDRHRKFWEWAYILQVLRLEGVLAPGKRALGFGTGREPLPSLLAKYGASVLATDAPDEAHDQQGWADSNQHSATARDLWHSDIISEADFLARVAFQPADMNRIPADLRDFDACWSSCCFEHLGSIGHGLDFVENSLGCLRPGGISVHTTEFNLDSNDGTYESLGLSIFRKRDFEGLFARLKAQGHKVWPLNTHPGFSELDQVIDLPPYQQALPHIKLQVAAVTTTSIGVVVKKAG